MIHDVGVTYELPTVVEDFKTLNVGENSELSRVGLKKTPFTKVGLMKIPATRVGRMKTVNTTLEPPDNSPLPMIPSTFRTMLPMMPLPCSSPPTLLRSPARNDRIAGRVRAIDDQPLKT